MGDNERTKWMANEPNEFRKRRCGLRLWHIAVGLLLLFVAAVLMMRWYWREELDKRIEAIRAAGDPVTLQELEASYEWPQSGDNAANWVLGMEGFLPKLTREEDKLLAPVTERRGELPLSEPLDAETLTLLERHVASSKEALEILHEAASIEGCRYPTNLTEGVMAPANHISIVRDAVRILCFEAALEAEHGNSESVVRSLMAALRIADSLAAEPMSISQLIRHGSVRGIISSLEWVMSRVEFTGEQLDALGAAVTPAYDPDSLRRGWVGSRCMGIAMLADLPSVGREAFEDLPPAFILQADDALGLADREAVYYLDVMQQAIHAASLAPEERPAAIQPVDDEMRQRQRKLSAVMRHLWIHPSRFITLDLRTLARVRVARVALAVERSRLAAGELPDDLRRLLPVYLESIPADPFDREPLRYRRLERGYVVYSVGEDYADDGGRLRNSEQPDQTWDIVFRVER